MVFSSRLAVFWLVLLCCFGLKLPAQAQSGTWQLVSSRAMPEIPARLYSSQFAFGHEGIWERTSGRYLQALPFAVAQNELITLAWTEPWLLALDSEGQVYQALLNPDKPQAFQPLRQFPYQHTEAENEADVLVHSGPWLASLSELPDGQQRFWIRDLRTGELAAEFSLPDDAVSAWDLDGEQLAIVRSNPLQPMLELWHWPSQKQVQVMDGPQAPVQQLRWHDHLLVSLEPTRLCSWSFQSDTERSASPRHCLQLNPGDVLNREAWRNENLFYLWRQSRFSQAFALAESGIFQPLQPSLPRFYDLPAKKTHTLKWVQLEQQRLLSLQQGHLLSIWTAGQTQAQQLDLCRFSPQPKAPCTVQIQAWQGPWVFLLVYPERRDPVEIYAYSEAGPTLTFSSQPHAVRFNLEQPEHSQVLKLPPARAYGQQSCLQQHNWFLLALDQGLVQISATGSEPKLLPLSLPYQDLRCTADQLLLQQWWEPEAHHTWKDHHGQPALTLSVNESLLAWTPTQLVSFLPDSQLLLRRSRAPASEAVEKLENSAIFAPACQQKGLQLFCPSLHQRWYRLDIQAPVWHLQSELQTSEPLSEPEQGLKLGPWLWYEHVFSPPYALFQRGSRHLALYFQTSGFVWVTDQGHFFRQGQLPDTEMPYLVVELKSLDLPAQLESWPEVQRALQGLPPLKASGLKLDFPQEDTCLNPYAC